MSSPVRSWVLTDGKQGMESQCLGLMEALRMEPEILRIKPRFPWSILPPQLWAAPLAAPGPDGDRLVPPWPDLLISTGRQTVAPALAIKRRQGNRTIAVQLQNPTVDPARFDLVISPAHDQLVGANVVSTLGALHRVTPDGLKAAATKFADRYATLPRPLVAVLLGGDNRQYRMTAECADRLGSLLAQMARQNKAGLAITSSRRTGHDNLQRILKRLGGCPLDYWDETGDNPYFAMLALADHIVVTGDSVNMVSEACATGKPVHVFQLEGGSKKFFRFHAELTARGITRPFGGRLENWRYTPPDDGAKAAAAVRQLLDKRGASTGDGD